MNRDRDIRSERAKLLQGLRAGFISRAISSGTDVMLVICAYVVGVALASIAWDLFFSKSIAISVPPQWLSFFIVWCVLVLYLASGWRFEGRTLGKQMMGLRVVGGDGTRLRFPRAFLRAVLCATFFPALLLAFIHRRNQGLEDVIFGTVVVYDWLPERTEPIAMEKTDGQIEVELREAPGPLAS